MPMHQNQVADKDLGYAKIAAGGADTATLISSLTFQGQGAAGIPPGTKLILISPETQAIRWRSDSGTLTTANGYPVAVGGELRYTGAQMGQLQVISSVAGAAVNVYAFG